MPDLEIKRNDVGATVEILLQEFDVELGDWAPIDLTDVTEVKLLMKSAAMLVWGIGDVSDPAGVIAYTFDEDDLDTAGGYQVEVQLTRAGGEVQTVPNNDYLTFVVLEDLG